MYCQPIKLAKIRKNAIFVFSQRWFDTFANDCIQCSTHVESHYKINRVEVMIMPIRMLKWAAESIDAFHGLSVVSTGNSINAFPVFLMGSTGNSVDAFSGLSVGSTGNSRTYVSMATLEGGPTK